MCDFVSSRKAPLRSRMVAVSLASGNLRFRDKLREKLEATGGVACKIHVGASIQKPESAPEVRPNLRMIHVSSK